MFFCDFSRCDTIFYAFFALQIELIFIYSIEIKKNFLEFFHFFIFI